MGKKWRDQLFDCPYRHDSFWWGGLVWLRFAELRPMEEGEGKKKRIGKERVPQSGRETTSSWSWLTRRDKVRLVVEVGGREE